MRALLLVLLPLALGLAACAPFAGRPNGWGAPLPAATAGTPAAPPVAEARPDVERPSPERSEPLPTASGLVIPVAGIAPDELRDSFDAPRSGGRTHHAIDIAAPLGTPVVAATDGVVVRQHWNALGGRTLYLRSADARYDYYYAHLDSYADDVEVGAEVERGQVLGTVGQTGNARGPHLHFQVLDLQGADRGAPVNPYTLLRAAEVALAR